MGEKPVSLTLDGVSDVVGGVVDGIHFDGGLGFVWFGLCRRLIEN